MNIGKYQFSFHKRGFFMGKPIGDNELGLRWGRREKIPPPYLLGGYGFLQVNIIWGYFEIIKFF